MLHYHCQYVIDVICAKQMIKSSNQRVLHKEKTISLYYEIGVSIHVYALSQMNLFFRSLWFDELSQLANQLLLAMGGFICVKHSTPAFISIFV